MVRLPEKGLVSAHRSQVLDDLVFHDALGVLVAPSTGSTAPSHNEHVSEPELLFEHCAGGLEHLRAHIGQPLLALLQI